ncbi:hypothetical protein [Enterococcus sp. BWR-S5]|uniref:hypothetical protein n=1 Tax=Enterococcus sp. BWR-S5 TaxID=2787714 RepID=UPI0019238C9B|nr:hypothetical protein [Enterococcus sp. BWR-S5]MBL1226497.1 ATP-binding protein [Enterococcus sp. BWR-S5]
MKLFRWKGFRIRKRHKGAPARFVFYLMLPVLAVTGFLEYMMISQGQTSPIILGSTMFSGFILSGIVAYLLLYFPLYNYYKRLLHKRKLAKMIISRRLFVEVAKTGKNAKGKKTVYFPKIFYQHKKGYIYVRFPLDLGPFQSKFNELAGELEEAFYCDMLEAQREEDYICYKLLYDIEKKRMNIKDLEVKDYILELMQGVAWEINKTPHALIAGGTGGGKTYFILSLLKALIPLGALIDVCDPKKADLLDLGDLPFFKDHVFFGGGILSCLATNVEEMNARYEAMKASPNYKTGKNYAAFGFKPKFIVVDEWPAYYSSLDTKERKRAMQLLNQIILMGRQSGYFLILGMQRPDAKYIDGALRDSFGLRVTLGKMSQQGYKMMFDSTIKSLFNKPIKGRGYADVGTEQVQEFYSPFVDSDFDFMEEFAKYPEQEVA